MSLKRCMCTFLCCLLAFSVYGCSLSKLDGETEFVEETAIPGGCILFADETMFPIGEPATVTFSVSSADSVDCFELVCEETGEILSTLEFSDRLDESYIYQGVVEVSQNEPKRMTIRAVSSSCTSTPLTLYFAPEITQSLLADAYIVTDMVAEKVREKYGSLPDEASLDFVADLLRQDSRVCNVRRDSNAVTYSTTDGIACIYTLPPEEDTFGTLAQDTPLTDAYLNEKDCADLYVYNDGSITNRDVLFLQSSDALTKTDYHETLCEAIADFVGGDFDIYREHSFYRALVEGKLCDYGTVVVNTHGASNAVYRADGSYLCYLLLKEDASAAMEEELTALNRYFYNFYDEQVELARITTEISGERAIFISTDFIMALYADQTFDNTIFQFSVCYLGLDTTFLQFLIDHGAQAVVSCPGALLLVNDADYCMKVADLLAEMKPDTSRSYTLLEALSPANSMRGQMGLYTRSFDFVYYGEGNMHGCVMDENGPVADAEIVAYRYMNHEFELRDVTRSSEDGSFRFRNMPWGTYIIQATSGGRRTAAQVNFSDTEGDCGNIYLGDTDASSADAAATLENYLRGTLIPQYGLMGTGIWEKSLRYTESVGIDELNGILSAYIDDLDGDTDAELLLLRLESAADTTDLYIEVYEMGDDGPYPADVCFFTTISYGVPYHSTQLSLFLSQNSVGDLCINLYANNTMNENLEVIRQFYYRNETLNQVATNAYFLGGDYWAYRYTQHPLEDASYQLLLYGLSEENGWEIVDRASTDSTYSDETIQEYTDKERAMFSEYREALYSENMAGGLLRNDRNSFRTLMETGEDPHYTVADLFDNADAFVWIADLSGIIYYGNGASVKRFEAVDFSGLGR